MRNSLALWAAFFCFTSSLFFPPLLLVAIYLVWTTAKRSAKQQAERPRTARELYDRL